MGLTAGSSLNSISFNVTTLSRTTNINHDNFNIKIAETGVANLSAGFVSGLTTVYGPQTYIPVTGANVFNFSAPLTWNGTSNIVVEVCYDNDATGSCTSESPICWSNAATVSVATAAANTVRHFSSDNTTSGARDMCSLTGGSLTTSRPVMTFGYTKLVQADITWSPVDGLFTDAAATEPYTGAHAMSVSASPLAGNHVYTVTATSIEGCENTASLD